MEERKTEFLRSHFEQIESQVQFGDHKASLLVAGDAILLATCGGLIRMVSGCPGDNFTVSCMVPSAALGFVTSAAALLVLSLFCALMAARPNRVHRRPPTELFLLSHIARMQRHTFIKDYEDASYSDLVEQALGTIHGKSVYADRKFRWLRWAIRATLLSLWFLGLTLLVAVASRVIA